MLANRLLCVLCFLLLLPLSLSSQLKPLGQTGATRAVVIGIAKYKNEQIPNLAYADADAQAFANYLRSQAGGSLPDSNMVVLINEEATLSGMVEALTWLLDVTQEDDEVIFFFSGHGDMETKTIRNNGYLLGHDANAAAYMASALKVRDVQDVMETLASENKAKLILITDACHAGKLAGGQIQGPGATAHQLVQRFASEVRLLSCQPDEFSAESEQWGGGHGAFTFFLLQGLMGLADTDKDGQVTLLELRRYLEDQVPVAVRPNKQSPIVNGPTERKMAAVDSLALAEWVAEQAAKAKDTAFKSPSITHKSPKRSPQDSSLMKKYRAFEDALARKHLLQPEEESAYTLYLALKDEPAMANYRQDMRRRLAAALQEEAQQAINDYLSASPDELQRRWSFDNRYERYPEYLDKAAEVLGETHFIYQDLKNKSRYFEGLNLRLKGEREQQSSLFQQAKGLQAEVIEQDTTAAYAYNELGLLARREKDYQGSLAEFNKALSLSPTWVLALANLCGSYVELEEYDQAKTACELALSYDSTFALAHHNLGTVFLAQEDGQAARSAFEQAIVYNPEYYLTHHMLGNTLYGLDEKAAAKAAWENAVQLNPKRLLTLYNLGVVSVELGQKDAALSYFQAVVAEDPEDREAYLEITELQIEAGRYTAAAAALQTARKLAPDHPDAYYLSGRLYARQGQADEALDALELAFAKGFKDLERLSQDQAWDGLRALPRFQALIQQ